MEIRNPLPSDLGAVMDLAADALGSERARPFVRSHVERHHLLVAEAEGEVVGILEEV
jgi:hypothetical protein